MGYALVGLSIAVRLASAVSEGDPQNNSSEAGKVQFEQTEYDFGTKMVGDEVEHTFIVANVGQGSLRLRMDHASCACTVALTEEGSIPPGKKGSITVKLRLSSTGAISEQVVLATTDPASPQVVLTLRGIAVNALRAFPNRLFFRASKGNEIQKTLTLTGPPAMEIKGISTSVPFLHATTERLQDDPTGVAYQVDVVLKSQTPVGPFTATVVIQTTHETNPTVTVPVQGLVTGDLEVNPPRVFFGIVKTATELKKDVIISSRTQREFQIRQVRCDDKRVHLSSPVPLQGIGYGFQAGIDTSADGLIDALIVVETDVELESRIEIPISAYVQR